MNCPHPTEMSGTCGLDTFGYRFCYYHRKLVAGSIESPSQYLTLEEIGATMGGRPHGDGRRLDQYVIDQRPALRGRR